MYMHKEKKLYLCTNKVYKKSLNNLYIKHLCQIQNFLSFVAVSLTSVSEAHDSIKYKILSMPVKKNSI